MPLNGTGLILEGGGLRGVYTSGVLRFFMDRDLYFPYVVGVSMGACNGANYVSRQPERNRIVNIRFVKDPRYLSRLRWLAGGELFGMRFLFDTIPNRLVPFDRKTYLGSFQRHLVGVTDCITGEALFFDQRDVGDDVLTVLQASCSLPFAARAVPFRGRMFMDGGIADPIPVQRSLQDGNRRHVLVLTRPRGYAKKRSSLMRLARLRYPGYPGLCRRLATRAGAYNRMLKRIDEMERNDEAFVIRPQGTLPVGRVDTRQDRLYAAYDQGYADAARAFPSLRAFLRQF
ncbi:MAG: patatin family protein [Desulfobacteraceae bacterium]|nr:patatin family protein [Desulfobacteraceae bacterium]